MVLPLSGLDLSGDDPYLIAAVPSTDPSLYPDEAWPLQFWSSARVVGVILGVARAYGAHFPELLLASHERTQFNHVQAEAVAEEVEFVGRMLRDPLVSTHCQNIESIALRVASSNGALLLVFEGQ
jgi:hypothetical protein